MKKILKSFISTLIFFIIYILIEFLFAPSINWKLSIVATVIYFISTLIINTLFSKDL